MLMPLSAFAMKQAAVASAHPLATRAAEQILRSGGNAFDAAVTLTSVLAVVEPYSSGIGGGGFWLLHRASDGFETMLDGREKAPLAATKNMFLDEQSNIVPNLSIDGVLSAGIPGVPAALVHLAKKYGNLSLSKSMSPAIKLAEKGFPVEAFYQKMAAWRLSALQHSPVASAVFLQQGQVPAIGYLIKQPDLANTLRLIAHKGKAGFYQGTVAQALVDDVQQAGGIWSMQDLAEYKVLEREPMQGHYLGYTITSAALPSSGGIVLLSALNILSGYDLTQLNDVQRQHVLIEALRRAYRDRAEFMGDSDFVTVPIQRLINADYAAGLARDIQLDKATPSMVSHADKILSEGMDTTHFSVMDAQGNRVSATLSVNYPFGSGWVAANTGVLLNDEMDDFSASPGVPNVYGLIGGEANAIASGKRMLSSMTPSFIENEAGVLIVGTPGGSRIISMIIQAVIGLSQGLTLDEIVARPRLHHQYLPDVVQFEKNSLSSESSRKLQQIGHNLTENSGTWGNMQAVYFDKIHHVLGAASDPRGLGEGRVFKIE